jgi:hypothetical protein
MTKPKNGMDFVKQIPNSQYIVLMDGEVARLLKPTIKNGKTYYILRITGEIIQYSVEEIEKLIKQFHHK